MDLLLLVILASLIGAAIVARVILWTTNRAATSAITRYFKASEYILETGEPPPEWLAPPWHKRLFGANSSAIGQRDLIARFDDMARFFENCSFFEDDWAREQMLEQLARVRESWIDRVFD